MATIKDVARSAGVSESTVSLVMNNKPGIKEETRERVWAAVRSLNYTPNRLAQSLATNKTFTIGLIITDIEKPFFSILAKHYYEEISGRDYSLIFSVSDDNVKTEDKIIYDFISRCVDAVIIVPSSEVRNDFTALNALKKSGIPFVFSTSYYIGFECDTVMSDLKAGACKLVSYLIELQHNDIVMLVGDDVRIPSTELRIEGYKKAFEDKNLPFSSGNIIECAKPDISYGYSVACEILKKRKPDAIITINDFMALGVEKAINEAGLKIPQDISVAGYNDVVFSAISMVPLTTVRQDIHRICSETFNILFRKERKDQELIKTVIDSELIVRQSTGICLNSK